MREQQFSGSSMRRLNRAGGIHENGHAGGGVMEQEYRVEDVEEI